MLSGSVFARDDTMFGVCEALGQDFGFSPNWLRALMGVGLLFNPFATFAAYGVAAILVVASRWLVPDPAMVEAAGDDLSEIMLTEDEQVELPLAA